MVAHPVSPDSGELTSWVTTPDDFHHIGYINDQGHLQDLHVHPGVAGTNPYSPYDITNDTVTKGVTGGALTSWGWPSDLNNEHVAFIAPTGHVLHVFAHPVPLTEPNQPLPHWGIRDITDDTGGVWAQGGSGLTTWFSTVDERQHVAYIDGSGHIQDTFINPNANPWGPWGRYDVMNDIHVLAAPGGLTSWWEGRATNTQHIAYTDGDGPIWEAWVTPNVPPWQVRQIA